MNDRTRDLFLWRWTRERAARRISYVAAGFVIGAGSGAVLGTLAEDFGGSDRWLPLAFAFPAFLLLAPLTRTALERWGPKSFAAFGEWVHAALILAFAVPLFALRDLSISGPGSIAAYISGGALACAVLALLTFNRNEERFHALIAKGAAIPEKRPSLIHELKWAGLMVLFVVAGFGPVLFLGLLQPQP